MSAQYRVEVDIDWLGGLRDRIGRMNIKPLQGWLIIALLAAIVLVMAFRGPTPAPRPPTPDPGPPAPGKVEPQPQPIPQPDPEPIPAQQPEAAASPLTKAVQEYVRTLPRAFGDLADKVESGELKDKVAAVKFSKQHAAAMAAAMDQVFSGAVDSSGKITDPAKIAAPLRETARALGAGRVRMSARTTEGP